jgi:hypothetical protein
LPEKRLQSSLGGLGAMEISNGRDPDYFLI